MPSGITETVEGYHRQTYRRWESILYNWEQDLDHWGQDFEGRFVCINFAHRGYFSIPARAFEHSERSTFLQFIIEDELYEFKTFGVRSTDLGVAVEGVKIALEGYYDDIKRGEQPILGQQHLFSFNKDVILVWRHRPTIEYHQHNPYDALDLGLLWTIYTRLLILPRKEEQLAISKRTRTHKFQVMEGDLAHWAEPERPTSNPRY